MTNQIKSFKVLALSLLMIVAFGITSCDKGSNELLTVEEFTDSAISSIQGRAVGKSACLEFIFPITIEFIDDSTLEAADYESLYTGIKAWFEANEVEKSKENRPSLVYPIQVLNEEGEIIDVDSQESLKELKSECSGKTGKCGDGKHGKGHSCFSLVFPIEVTIGAVTATFEDRATLKAAIKAYKQEVGDDAERPQLIFPVTVIYEDDTTATAANSDELKALKAACDEG